MSHTTESELHGPAACPCECTLCSGEHCWIEETPDESGGTSMGSRDKPHEAETKYNLPCWFVCRHCEAWATCEYVWALEEEDE